METSDEPRSASFLQHLREIRSTPMPEVMLPVWKNPPCNPALAIHSEWLLDELPELAGENPSVLGEYFAERPAPTRRWGPTTKVFEVVGPMLKWCVLACAVPFALIPAGIPKPVAANLMLVVVAVGILRGVKWLEEHATENMAGAGGLPTSLDCLPMSMARRAEVRLIPITAREFVLGVIVEQAARGRRRHSSRSSSFWIVLAVIGAATICWLAATLLLAPAFANPIQASCIAIASATSAIGGAALAIGLHNGIPEIATAPFGAALEWKRCRAKANHADAKPFEESGAAIAASVAMEALVLPPIFATAALAIVAIFGLLPQPAAFPLSFAALALWCSRTTRRCFGRVQRFRFRHEMKNIEQGWSVWFEMIAESEDAAKGLRS